MSAQKISELDLSLRQRWQTWAQLLLNGVTNDQGRLLFPQIRDRPGQNGAEMVLKELLVVAEDEEWSVSTLELKACVSHRLMILSALMLRNTPRLPLLATAMRVRYRRCSDEELGKLAAEWNGAPPER